MLLGIGVDLYLVYIENLQELMKNIQVAVKIFGRGNVVRTRVVHEVLLFPKLSRHGCRHTFSG
jgi:hypothetical protein